MPGPRAASPRPGPPAADLFVTYSIGEETGEAEIGPLSVCERGYRAPLIINGEPTNLRVAPATMGWFFFRITIEGKSLHPAARYTAIYPRPGDVPPAGVDAVEKARKIMDALSHLERDWALYQHHPVMPPGGMNLCHVSIQGGSYRAEMPPVARWSTPWSTTRLSTAMRCWARFGR